MAWFSLSQKSKIVRVKNVLAAEQKRVQTHPLLQTRFQFAAALFGQYQAEVDTALLSNQGAIFMGLQLGFLGAQGRESAASFLGPGMTAAGDAVEKVLKNSLSGEQKEYALFFRDLWWLLCLGILYIKGHLKGQLAKDGQASGQKLAEELTLSFLLRSHLLEKMLSSLGDSLEWEEGPIHCVHSLLRLATYLFWLVSETERKVQERLLRLLKPFLQPLFVSVEDEIEKSVGNQPALMAAVSLLQKSVEDLEIDGVIFALEQGLQEANLSLTDWRKEILWMQSWMESVAQQWSLLLDPSHTHSLNVMQTA